MTIEEHVLFMLESAEQILTPFPHIFAINVFPTDFYTNLQTKLATKSDFHAEKFRNREFADSIAEFPEVDFMLSKDFLKRMLFLFKQPCIDRFGGQNLQFRRDLRLIRDSEGYAIGPHTDSPDKVLSLLFYLPSNEALREYGTSILVPNDPTFRCPGTRHHNFSDFTEIWRAPFLPNTCLGFWKTDASFHGVYPIPIPIRRDVLLYNIYCVP